MTTSPTTTEFTLTLYSADDFGENPGLLEIWESLVPLGNPLNRAFAGPATFLTHARLSPHAGNRFALVRGAEGEVIGGCPVVHWDLEMPLQFRRHILAKLKVQAATILCGEPLLPQNPAPFQVLLNGLLKELPWCDCLYFNAIPADCFTSRFLYGQNDRIRQSFVYPRTLNSRRWIYHELEGCFEDYLQTKHKRTRNTLKRRVKKLREQGGGVLVCERIEDIAQVDSFYEAAYLVAEKSWQFRSLGRALEDTALYQENLRSLAQLGVLRAYLLRCGDRPCAFVIGVQYQDVLQFEQTAYSGDLGSFSPGTVLYYLMLEDVYTHRRPKYINYGTGINPHKQLFSNRESHDTAIYLFRPTLQNQTRATVHGLFYSSLELAKRFASKKGPDHAVAGDDEDP